MMNFQQQNLSLEAVFFSVAFKRWFWSVTWKKSVTLLMILVSILTIADVYLFFQPRVVPKLFSWQLGRMIFYWVGPLNGAVTFIVVVLTLMIMSLTFLSKAISSFPFDPSTPYESARACWDASGNKDNNDARDSQKSVHYEGSVAINFISVSLFACSYMTHVLLTCFTLFFSLGGNLDLMGIMILMLTSMAGLLVVGIVVSIVSGDAGVIGGGLVGFLGSNVIGIVGFISVLVFGVSIGFIVSIAAFIGAILIVPVVLLVDRFKLFRPFTFESEDEWRSTILYKEISGVIHGTSMSDSQARKKLRELSLSSPQAVLEHFGYLSLEDFLIVIKNINLDSKKV